MSLLLMSCKLFKSNQNSVYEILNNIEIKKVTIKSFQFAADGKVLLEMNSPNEIANFKSWFKPSKNSVVDSVGIKIFQPNGVIIVSAATNKDLEIYFQLFNCYRLNYLSKLIYEKFSYQMGQTLLELIEEEARLAGKKFQQ